MKYKFEEQVKPHLDEIRKLVEAMPDKPIDYTKDKPKITNKLELTLCLDQLQWAIDATEDRDFFED